MSESKDRRLEWQSKKLLPAFVNCRYAWIIVALLLAVHSGLLAYSGHVHSPTLNEPAHLAAGISHWQLGEFGLYRVNPPLIRMVAALPVLGAGVKTDWRRLHPDRVVRPDFTVGDDLIAANGERSFLLFTIARWACIPFTWIGGVVCWLWARDLYGWRAGLLAVALWSFSPTILGHASLITPDGPAAALFIAASYTFWRWLRSPTWRHAIFAGAVLGVTELSKTTFIVLYLFWPLLWVFYRFSDRTTVCARRWRGEGTMLLVSLGIGVFAVNLGYGFDGSFQRLGDYQFISKALTGQDSATAGNRFAGSAAGRLPVPFPKDYVLGMDAQRGEFERYGRPSYLAGEFRDTGWWYYYLYALAIKVPLGIWGLLLLTLVARLFSKVLGDCLGLIPFRSAWRGNDARGAGRLSYAGARPPFGWRDEWILLFPAVTLLIIASCQTGFSEHLRYVLPMFPLVFVWIGQVGRSFSRASWRPLWASGFLCWALGSSLWAYPHSLAYFNEIVGGANGGSAHLLGSNADWGQDLRYLKWWLDEHPGIDSIYLAFSARYDPAHLGVKYSAPPPCLMDAEGSPQLQPGWYAISVNFLRGYPGFARDGHGGAVVYERDALSCFLRLRPTAVVGASIYLFNV